MELLNYLIVNIMQLPWIVKGPGLFFMFAFLFKAIRHLFKLKFVSAVTSLLLSFIVALIFARWGHDIAAFVQALLTSPAPQSN